MANSIRDTLDDTEGYQISYRPPSLIPLPGRAGTGLPNLR